MVVQHNLTAMNANRYLGINNNKLSKSLEKLSSGYQINRAGDNAAGLAVSEKMRSQIAGMTQGVKNAQDGISMVQTFEGALTETHSILQRMKTLADQMANGSYDDPVDRTAAQQEFLQLNDELDQIADTDFNGVIVLNGGQMADGTKAVNGQFDYKAGAKAASKLDKVDVNLVDEQAWNNTANKAKVADTAWSALNSAWNRFDSLSDNNGPDSVDLTFKYDGATSTWSCIDASNGAEKTAVGTTKTADGGFGITIGGTKYANVVIDQDKLANGDTITLTFKNPAAGVSAPTNAGAVVADSTGYTAGSTAVENVDLAVAKGSLSDANMTEGANEVYKLFDGGKTSVTYGLSTEDQTTYDEAQEAYDTSLSEAATTRDEAITTAGETRDSAYTDAAAEADETTKAAMIALADKAYEKSVGEAQAAYTTSATTAKTTFDDAIKELATNVTNVNIELTNGTKLAFDTFDGTQSFSIVKNNETFTVTAKEKGVIEVTDADSNKLMTLTPKDLTDDKGTSRDAGTISYTLGFENYEYDAAAKPSVEVAKSGNVSKSNAFNKSEAILTYKDNITLQVGARTKDAVNFTFQYASTSIGDLKDDLDCTSRGLGTNLLNINTQESANYAIDKIDQAINKVSLIRGTFGAIQNRLEHKIDNMNVSIENLTSAESQIRDTNMPQEMMNFTKNQILAQASQSMLAQANQLPQSVLSLLQ